MKALSKSTYIPALTLIGGCVGALARYVLYASGFDDRGLLSANHPLHILCWVLTVCIAGFLLWAVRDLNGSNGYKGNFPASRTGGIGCVLAAGCFLLHGFSVLEDAGDRLNLIRAVMAFASVLCFLYNGWCRWQGIRPTFLLHTAICLCFGMEMLCSYRSWSGNPQLADYCFHLLACVFLVLAAYQHAAFTAGMGRRRMLLFCSLMAAFLCLMSLIGPGESYFYFGGAIWAAAGMCRINPPKRRRPVPPVSGQEG